VNSDVSVPRTDTDGLHPRVAVLLGVNTHWHKWLYFCRLLSVTPELRFGIPLLWTVLKRLLILRGVPLDHASPTLLQRRLTAVELVLAPFWVQKFPHSQTHFMLTQTIVRCCWLPLLLLHRLPDDTMVSAFLHLLCLASQLIKRPRLLFYTPAAAIFRLATANIFNYIITSSILDRTGSHKNVRMILPAWIFVALVSLIHVNSNSQLNDFCW